MSHFETPLEKQRTNDREVSKAYLAMQVDLMRMSLGHKPAYEAELAWVEHNSKDFAELIEEHQDLFEQYRGGDEDRRRLALQKMEELLASRREARFNKAA